MLWQKQHKNEEIIKEKIQGLQLKHKSTSPQLKKSLGRSTTLNSLRLWDPLLQPLDPMINLLPRLLTPLPTPLIVRIVPHMPLIPNHHQISHRFQDIVMAALEGRAGDES